MIDAGLSLAPPPRRRDDADATPEDRFLEDADAKDLLATAQHAGSVCLNALLTGAAKLGNLGAVRALLVHGAHPTRGSLNILAMAASEGHASVVEALLNAGTAVSHADRRAALMAASENGQCAVVRWLIEAGVSVNGPADGAEASAIHRAASGGHAEVAEVLLAAGANPNSIDKLGGTALHAAAARGVRRVVELLISAGAELERADAAGQTPLYIACDCGRKGAAEALLHAGARFENLPAVARDGSADLHWAAGAGLASLVARLLADSPPGGVDSETYDGMTALHWAAIDGHADVVALLLEAGADVNKADHAGQAPLHRAADLGNEAVVRTLISAGADIDGPDDAGMSALATAAYEGQAVMCTLLLEAGADVNKADHAGQAPLYIAACQGREAVARILIAAGAEVDRLNAAGWSALAGAAGEGKAAMCALLLEAGADPNLRGGGGGDTLPLVLAVAGQHKDAALLLAVNGASVDGLDPDIGAPNLYNWLSDELIAKSKRVESGRGELRALDRKIQAWCDGPFAPQDKPTCVTRGSEAPMLHVRASGAVAELMDAAGAAGQRTMDMLAYWSAALGHHRGVERLVARGARPDKSASGIPWSPTALSLAAERGHVEAVCALLAAGEDPDEEDAERRWQTPLMLAAHKGHLGVVHALLLAGVSARQASKKGHGINALCNAAVKGHKNVVKLLLAFGADASQADSNGHTGLHLAVLKNDRHMAELLLRCGSATSSADDDGGSSPLHLAAARGSQELIRLLLDFGADIHKVDECGNTPLHSAAKGGFQETVRLLLDSGADIHKADDGGDTPLHDAVRHSRVVEVLVASGADVSATSSYGRTPLYLACCVGNTASAEILLGAGARLGDVVRSASDGSTELHWAARAGLEGMVESLLGPGLVDKADNAGQTPLHVAAANGHVKVVSLLMKLGAEVDKVDRCGWTPLHHATKGAHLETMKVLLDARAMVNKPADYGKTCLHKAAREGKAIIRLLLSRGADIEALDDDGCTPLSHAARFGYLDNCTVLLEAGANIDGGAEKPLISALRGRFCQASAMLLMRWGASLDCLVDHADIRALHYRCLQREIERKGKVVAEREEKLRQMTEGVAAWCTAASSVPTHSRKRKAVGSLDSD